MIDGIIKETGNSRFLKSAITSSETWEEFRAKLIAGTAPIDLNGINEDGWQQIGMPLNKEHMLDDNTTSAMGIDSESTPNDAFEFLSNNGTTVLRNVPIPEGETVTAFDVVDYINGEIEVNPQVVMGDDVVGYTTTNNMYQSYVYALSADKVVLLYQYYDSSTYRKTYLCCRVGRVTSGRAITRITWGDIKTITYTTATTTSSVHMFYVAYASITESCFVVIYGGTASSDSLGIRMMGVEGLEVTLGSSSTLNSASGAYGYFASIAALSESKFVYAYVNSEDWCCYVGNGTVTSDTTFTHSKNVIGEGAAGYTFCAKVDEETFILGYGYPAIICVGTVSGSSFLWGNTQTVQTGNSYVRGVFLLENNRVAVLYSYISYTRLKLYEVNERELTAITSTGTIITSDSSSYAVQISSTRLVVVADEVEFYVVDIIDDAITISTAFAETIDVDSLSAFRGSSLLVGYTDTTAETANVKFGDVSNGAMAVVTDVKEDGTCDLAFDGNVKITSQPEYDGIGLNGVTAFSPVEGYLCVEGYWKNENYEG